MSNYEELKKDFQAYESMETEMIDEAWIRYGLSDAISATKTPDTYSDAEKAGLKILAAQF